MRRDSERVRQVVEHCRAAGISYRGRPVTGLDIEKLSGGNARLLPAKDASDEVFAVYVAELDALNYKPGVSSQDVALCLLARGLPSEEARIALEKRWSGFNADGLRNSPYYPALTLDQLWSQLLAAPLTRPFMEKVGAALDDIPEGGREDYAGVPLVETPEARKSQVVQDALGMIAGKGLPGTEDTYLDLARSRKGPFGHEPDCHEERVSLPDELDHCEQISAELNAHAPRIPEIVRTASLRSLAVAAMSLVPFLAYLPYFDERQRELSAAILSPVALAMIEAGQMGPLPVMCGACKVLFNPVASHWICPNCRLAVQGTLLRKHVSGPRPAGLGQEVPE